MAQLIQVRLSRFDAQPWGFRLQGGTDYGTPLVVQKVNAGSLSEQAGLLPGDEVVKINDVDCYALRHKDAQDLIVRSGNTYVLTIQRGQATWRPHVQPTGNMPSPQGGHLGGNVNTVTKTSLAHRRPQEEEHIGCGYNNAARPYNSVNGNGPVKSIVNKQYNSPVGIYSDESIAETLSAQAEVLAEGVLGVNFKKNEKQYNAEKSEVLKFLREAETDPSEHVYNNNHEQHNQSYNNNNNNNHNSHNTYQNSGPTRHVMAPVDQPKPQGTGGHSMGAQNICDECDRLIVGVFVRIKDKNLHAECFKCATCGTSLKNQGYYNFNNKLYCDIHAKLAAQQNPPTGTEGYVPVPIRAGTKLSAGTISAALNAHGYQGIPPSANVPIANFPAQNKVINQQPARPYGQAPKTPPQASPKSPVSYPPPGPVWAQRPAPTPQAQQSPYATLPRSNFGGSQGANYGAPQPSYGGQQQSYGAPQQSYGGQQQSYGAPQHGPSYGAPQQGRPNYNTTHYKQPGPCYNNRGSNKSAAYGATSAPKRGRGILNKAVGAGYRTPQCNSCGTQIRGPFITALGRIWCPEHFICVNAQCRRPLQDIGFVEEKGDLYCEYCFEQYLAPQCSKCNGKIKGDCLNAIGKHFHPECFNCFYCGKLFGNTPFFLEEGNPYCEADWNELFTTKCFACGFPVEAGDRWVEALNHNYHSQCFNCTMCKKNLEGQSFYNKGGRPFCKNHAR